MNTVTKTNRTITLTVEMTEEEADTLTEEIDYLLSLNSEQRGPTLGMHRLPEIYNAIIAEFDY